MRVFPGAQLFFAGRSAVSRGIALRTWSPLWVSHIGCGFDYDGKMMVGESTTLCDLPCAITGKYIKGVQAHPVEARVNAYPGRVWCFNPIVPLTKKKSAQLTQLIVNRLGEPYDDTGALISGMLGLRHCWNFRQGHWFCSELDAYWLDQVMPGVIPKSTRASRVWPGTMLRWVRSNTQFDNGTEITNVRVLT